MTRDDLGEHVPMPGVPRRVVSLVPSLTEAIALSAPGVLVGATDWCVHPADLSLTRVRGTKNPDLDAIAALAPDLVVANEEENREPDVLELRRRGLSVWVTDIRTVEGALASIARLLDVLAAPRREWLSQARAAWAGPPPAHPARRLRAVTPIWRKPWMFVGDGTYAGDVLARLGVDNALAGRPGRYPRLRLAELPAYELVVLPDEPYPFSPADGPEHFLGTPCALVDGRSLTWYGPAMIAAPQLLGAAVAAAWEAAQHKAGERP